MGLPKIEVLTKCILLLHRESELGENSIDNSKDLIKTILNLFKNNNKTLIGGDSVVIEELKSYVSSMVNNPEILDTVTVLESLSYILRDKIDVFNNISKSLKAELTNSTLKKSILATRALLTTYWREQEAIALVNKSAYKLNVGLDGEDLSDFVNKLITNLEALVTNAQTKDPGVIDSLDIADSEQIETVFKKIKKNSEEGGLLKTGWSELNNMLQGGVRRGEFAVLEALQHKYKSGFTQSLFAQLPRYNQPTMLDNNKKPLMLYISFEDDAIIVAEFIYRYLYNNENGKPPVMADITPAEIASYIKERLTATGYHIKLMRVNPSEWTYKNVFNTILDLEAQGYEIHACFLDYLAKLPTTGCTISGPAGTDVRNLFDRVRNFFTARHTFTLTPHQLSTEAKQLIRNGESDLNFVKLIAGKGYSELSKQIDQVVDLELYIHIGKVNKKPILCVGLGKHRKPVPVDEKYKFFTLDFPYQAPIMDTINKTKEENMYDAVEFDL